MAESTNCESCKNYELKVDYKKKDIFVNKYGARYMLTYVGSGSFLSLYSEAGSQHGFHMGGYCLMCESGYISGTMYYTIEELFKRNKDLKRIGHMEDFREYCE